MVLITMPVLMFKCLMGLVVDINMLKDTIKDISKEMEQDIWIKDTGKVAITMEFHITIDPDHQNISNKMSIMILIMGKAIIMLMIYLKGRIY